MSYPSLSEVSNLRSNSIVWMLMGRSVLECPSSWAVFWIRPGKMVMVSSRVSFLEDFYQPFGTTAVTVANCCLCHQVALADWRACLGVGLWPSGISACSVIFLTSSRAHRSRWSPSPCPASSPADGLVVAFRSLPLQLGGRALWGMAVTPRNVGTTNWPNFIINSWGASAYPARWSFSFLFLFFLSFVPVSRSFLFNCTAAWSIHVPP